MKIEVPNDHYEYFVFGLKRSGNHAIINWILQHFDSYIHYNNCFVEKEKIYVDCKEDISIKGNSYQIHLVSFEDKPDLNNTDLNKISKFKFKKNIIILRDAYNTYASRYMKKKNPTRGLEWWNDLWLNYNDPSLWISCAKYFLDENNLSINFNNWFSNKEYREKISHRLQRAHTDAGLYTVPKNGGGSSFDLLNYDQKAQQMKVLKRYKSFLNNRNFNEKIIFNKEIQSLNKFIFNFYIKNKIYI